MSGKLEATVELPAGGRSRLLGDGVARLARKPIVRVCGRRLFFAIPLLFVVSALSFLLVSLTPGDAARDILGTDAPPEAYPKLRHALGLDLPLYEQYWRWARHAVTGDFGLSLLTQQPVATTINERLPVTLSLTFCALVTTVVVGVCLGAFSAVRGGVAGRVVDAVSLAGFALPGFWVGAVLISVFAVKLRWLPAVGYVPLSESPIDWARSLALPVAALSLHGVAAIAKQTRESMLDALGSEHIRMARANGISESSIVFRHTLRNAAIPVVTVVGIQAVGLLGGTLFIENVFALPGLGTLVVQSSSTHDLPLVQGIAVYFTVIVVVVNLLIDLAYTWLNPRVRAE